MGAWIEIHESMRDVHASSSHPTMGAWIEIEIHAYANDVKIVAPHDGCVD